MGGGRYNVTKSFRTPELVIMLAAVDRYQLLRSVKKYFSSFQSQIRACSHHLLLIEKSGWNWWGSISLLFVLFCFIMFCGVILTLTLKTIGVYEVKTSLCFETSWQWTCLLFL